jgi:hypothetical protein
MSIKQLTQMGIKFGLSKFSLNNRLGMIRNACIRLGLTMLGAMGTMKKSF